MGKIWVGGTAIWADGATDQESLDQRRTEVAVTPSNLAAIASSSTVAITGTGTNQFITPAAPRAVIKKLKVLSFTGKSGAGACTLTGAAVGDIVIGVTGIATVGGASASFEATISTINQIQQSSASDLSLLTYTVILLAIA